MLEKKDVLKIKKQIEESKKTLIEKETRRTSELEYAKKNFDLTTLEEIDEELDKREKALEELDVKIERQSKILEGAYPWNI